MTLRTDTVYADDTSAWVEREVTDNKGADLTWTPNVAVDAGGYTVAGAWQGTVGPKRVLRIPVVGLTAGTHRLYLQNPNGPDWSLGSVRVQARN